jgi:DNA-binding transcriptional MerR regulator
MNIGEVARAANTKAETIRYYERIGILAPPPRKKEQSCEAVDAIAREHLTDVKRKLADLAALRRELDALIGQCRHGTIAECRILEALNPRALVEQSGAKAPR